MRSICMSQTPVKFIIILTFSLDCVQALMKTEHVYIPAPTRASRSEEALEVRKKQKHSTWADVMLA